MRALALALVLVALPLAAAAQNKVTPLAEGREAVTLQGRRYGTLRDDHPTTVKVRGVFERIVRAAGRRPAVVFEVYVLDTPRIIAEALPGGLVTVSTGLVDLTAGDDDALAFVLAHEIAHHVRDHHAILDSLGVLGASVSADRGSANDHVARTYQVIELDADRLGVLFATLAGYRPTAAVPTVVQLAERSGPDRFHPSPKERASVIRSTLLEVADHLEIFHFGLFLLNANRPLEAARVLEHFATLFPSREVLSAIGVAYHREALRHVPVPEFRHALVVDGVTRGATARGAPPPFRAWMERALHYYRLASDADPDYAPVLTNLGAAHLDLGDRDLALSYFNRALRADAGLAAAYNNRALVAIATRDYRKAEHDLLTAAKRIPGLPVVPVNLARLYEVDGRSADARRWAGRLAASAPEAARRQESLGTLTPGMTTQRLPEWVNQPATRHIKVPLGTTVEQTLTLMVNADRGVALVVKDALVEAVGATGRPSVATAHGLRPGDRLAKLETLYGRAGGLYDLQAFDVWAYPARAVTVFTSGERVHSIWIGRLPVTQARGNE